MVNSRLIITDSLEERNFMGKNEFNKLLVENHRVKQENFVPKSSKTYDFHDTNSYSIYDIDYCVTC